MDLAGGPVLFHPAGIVGLTLAILIVLAQGYLSFSALLQVRCWGLIYERHPFLCPAQSSLSKKFSPANLPHLLLFTKAYEQLPDLDLITRCAKARFHFLLSAGTLLLVCGTASIIFLLNF
jgi:hypothetical protein